MAQGYCDKDCKSFTEGQSRGDQYQCGVCGRYTKKSDQSPIGSEQFTENNYSAMYVVSSSKRVTSIEEVEALCTFDKNVWEIERWQQEAGVSEGYRKDKQVSLTIENGKMSGMVEDSGRMLVVPLHSFKIRVWLKRKTEEIRKNVLKDEFIAEVKNYAPKYQKISYKKSKSPHLFELGLPDLQLGRLVMAEEAGRDIDVDSQIALADAVVDRLISYASNFGVSRCMFPIGNDFFDTNSEVMSTKHGTPMDDDIRWKRTYKLGCQFVVRTVEKLMQLAPVDVVVVPGNHDEDKIWHLGEYSSAWFNKSKDVVVDNGMKKRKYRAWGKNLVMLTHGYHERMNKLDSLMAYEVPQLWAQSVNREVHLGDKHHKVDMVLKTNELENGVVVRILRNLASPSVWEYDKGFVGSLHAGESFLWHEEEGVIAQFTASK